VVYKLDRLARSLSDLLRVLERIKACGASIRSVTEPVDTDTPIGTLMVQQLGAFAQFERSIMRERCNAGIRAAMQRGVKFGRPRKFDWSLAAELRRAGETTREIATRLGVCQAAVRVAVRASFQAGR
jgi:DNA invertase Pin-like site-specific DNA recombinase